MLLCNFLALSIKIKNTYTFRIKNSTSGSLSGGNETTGS